MHFPFKIGHYVRVYSHDMMLLWVFNVQDVDNRCGDSHWRAANNHGRKAAKLDETGLEIAGQNKM